MNISDTFYVALCMTILIIGVVYWFWTQNQYIQRKLNLLENIVYEMKTNLNTPALPTDASRTASAQEQEHEQEQDQEQERGQQGQQGKGQQDIPTNYQPGNYPPAPSSELGDDEDLLHEDLHKELLPPVPEEKPRTPMPQALRPISPIAELPKFEEADDIADDLQPGGVGSSLPVEVSSESSPSTLDSMTLKELRRLAEQRKIPGFSNMRKQALIDALRNGISDKKDEIHELNLDV